MNQTEPSGEKPIPNDEQIKAAVSAALVVIMQKQPDVVIEIVNAILRTAGYASVEKDRVAKVLGV